MALNLHIAEIKNKSLKEIEKKRIEFESKRKKV
jgi:hypothetical protein